MLFISECIPEVMQTDEGPPTLASRTVAHYPLCQVQSKIVTVQQEAMESPSCVGVLVPRKVGRKQQSGPGLNPVLCGSAWLIRLKMLADDWKGFASSTSRSCGKVIYLRFSAAEEKKRKAKTKTWMIRFKGDKLALQSECHVLLFENLEWWRGWNQMMKGS